MGYTHIVFDVDGTLIDTFYSNMQSLQDTLKEFTGQVYPLEELRVFFGIPGSDTMERLGLPDPAVPLAWWEERLGQYCHADRVYDGIPQLLTALSGAGRTLGIVTSRTRVELDAAFADLDIAPLFSHAVCADDTALHKPHADPLLKYMEWADCGKEEVLYIGDSEYDMACAAAAGVASGLAVWGAVGRWPCTHPFAAPADVERLVLG